MKINYLTLLFIAILLIFFSFLYFVKIPTPSKTIVETYDLDIK